MRTRLAVILAIVTVLAVVPALHAGHTHGYCGHNGDLDTGCALCSSGPTVGLSADGAPAQHFDDAPAALVVPASVPAHEINSSATVGSRAPPQAR